MNEAYPQNPVLYLDGDTFFTQNYQLLLGQITEKHVLMHIREYTVDTHTTGQMKRFRENMKKLSFEGKPIDLSVFMWNAGVIGFMPVYSPL